jgi:hypothetical protein
MIEQKKFCWSDDEARIDIIGLNGNDGDHYEAKLDMVNSPPHYTHGAVECIDAIQSALGKEQFKGYLKGAALKYIWRLEHKGDAEENAEKAIWYLKKLLEVLK